MKETFYSISCTYIPVKCDNDMKKEYISKRILQKRNSIILQSGKVDLYKHQLKDTNNNALAALKTNQQRVEYH